MTQFPNVQKVARLFDRALGVVFSLITLGFWFIVMLILVVLVL